MKIEQLIYFVETAKQEHVGRAAKILGISPSAISHSVSALQNELRMKLFEKRGKSIYLTPAGKKLLGRSEKLIGEFRLLHEELAHSENQTGHFKFGATHFLASSILAPSWGALSPTYSEISAELFTLRSADVIKGVLDKELDWGICFSPQKHPDLVYQQLKKGELELIVNTSHPVLKTKANQRLRELSQYPAVLPKAFQGIEICIQDPMFKKFGIKPNPKTLIDSYEVLLKTVETTSAWSLLPDLLLSQSNAIKTITPKQGWSSQYEICVLWRKDRFIPRLFIELAEEASKRLRNL